MTGWPPALSGPARAGAIALGALALLCLLGPPALALAGLPAEARDLALGAAPPSLAHPLGADALGRDALARALVGGRLTLLLAACSWLVALAVGGAGGALAAALPRPAGPLRAAVRAIAASPRLLLAVLLLVALSPSALLPGGLHTADVGLPLCLGALAAPDVGRVVRVALEALAPGAPRLAVALRAAVGGATAALPWLVAGESAISFLGLGLHPPASTWGTLAREGADAASVHPWLFAGPAVLLVVTLAALRVLAQGSAQQRNPVE